MRLALYQPEIAQNTGTLLRTCACLNVGIDIIEPCGFVFSSSKIRRSGMDYIDHVDLIKHASWSDFLSTNTKRLVLLTPHTEIGYYDFKFEKDDILLLGQESCGVPEEVFNQCNAAIKIPMYGTLRSLNVAIAGSMVLGEAIRQTSSYR